MSEIIVNMSGFGSHSIKLDLHDPAPNGEGIDVWIATFCDLDSTDCEMVYFEADTDCEVWDVIDEAIQTYRREIADTETQF